MFKELTFQEQAKAINMTALQFRKQLVAHFRRANQEGRSNEQVLSVRLRLLERILEAYRGRDCVVLRPFVIRTPLLEARWNDSLCSWRLR